MPVKIYLNSSIQQLRIKALMDNNAHLLKKNRKQRKGIQHLTDEVVRLTVALHGQSKAMDEMAAMIGYQQMEIAALKRKLGE